VNTLMSRAAVSTANEARRERRVILLALARPVPAALDESPPS
jgi:hypothetical protein